MLDHPTHDQLRSLKLDGMADAFTEPQARDDIADLSHTEWLGLLIDREAESRSTPIPETVTLHIPYRVVKRGGRKEMPLPEGAVQPRRDHNTLVKALSSSFRWKRMLESGEYATIAELAEREGIVPSYLTRVLRLTLLAPDIVEAILERRQGANTTFGADARAVSIGVERAATRPQLTGASRPTPDVC